jgi:ADP-heptose:LPS heptosyltransferase|tara:strand:- start:220 stop:2037 length:1818 start_codon:yes stop_codon:yes gene_type:complete
MISPSPENNISAILAYRGSDCHLLDVFLDLKPWVSDITIVGPVRAAILEEIKIHGGHWIESESPNICELWERGMRSTSSSWYLLLEGKEYLSTILKESIVETSHSAPVQRTWFPIEREIFLLKQRLKYPLEWTHDPRPGLLFVGTDKSMRIDLIPFPGKKLLKGRSIYFAESTMAEVVTNTIYRAEQAADQLYRTNPGLGPFTLVSGALTASLSNFFRNWILRKGMREGFEGLIFSVLDLAAVVLGHLRFYEKYIRSGRQIKDRLNSVKKILIIKLRGLGDAVLATPVIKNINKLMPGSSITILTFNFCKPLFENNPHLEAIYGLSGEPTKEELSRLVAQLSRKNFDLILNLHARNLSSQITRKIKARWRINRSYFLREKYSDILIGSDHALDKTSIERDLDCLRAIGLNPQDKNPEIFITDKEIQWAEDFIVEQKIDPSKKLIIIHPTSSQDHKNWDLERFITLSHQLIHDHGYQVLGYFSEQEQSIANLLLDQVDGVFAYVGPLRPSMALISKADLLIDNCSGPSHISMALDIPTFVLMGVDFKNTYRDENMYKGKHFLFFREVPCRDPYLSKCLPPNPCQNRICMDHSVEDVLKKSLEVLRA